MAKLSLAARDTFVQLPEVIDFVTDGLIGSDPVWDNGWVFDQEIPRTLDNQSHTSVVVFGERQWLDMNPHNSARFPMLIMDIWAAPTRDGQNSIESYDADDLIEQVFNAVLPYFHTMNKDVPGNTGDAFIPYMGSPGQVRYWGTPTQISSKTGVPIFSSTCISIEDFRDVEGGNGVRMRRHQFGVETA